MGVADRAGLNGDCDRAGGGGVQMRTGASAGGFIRTGGVPWRGGDWPRESDRAAARAEIPGPWVYD